MENINYLKARLTHLESRENDLARLVEELTDFIENASLPLHWVDSNGIILWANQAELDALGYSKEEYIGFHIGNFHADQEVIGDILSRLTNNETLHNYSARLKCKDGSIKHVLINSNVFRKEGEFVHTRCFTRDITPLVEEKHRQELLLSELEESEARLKMAIDSTNLGTWDYNAKANDLYCDGRCKAILGYTENESLTVQQFLNQIPKEDKEQVHREIEGLTNLNNRYDVTHRIHSFRNNSILWIKVQGRAYFDREGKADRFIGTALDISNARLAEETSAILTAIIKSTDDAIISKTLDGVVTSWNGSAERIFGYTAAEMIGESILKIIPADRHEEEHNILERLRKGERMENFESKRITKSGKSMDVSLTISRVTDARGNIIGLSNIARDITEKKQAEQQKNDFVGMVSHELKTPLTSITGYIQLLRENAKSENDFFSINALTRVEVQVKKMTSLIHDFLNQARFEAGNVHIDKELFEVKPLADEVAAEAQFLSSNHLVHIEGCENIMVNADREKIALVLVNLLSNAIKYSPDGGNITIGCQKDDRRVKIYVSDQGVGIAPENQRNLFDRFYRIKNDKIKSVSGFGIGLYIVSEILHYHNSKIEVTSKEGFGSTFYFTLDTC